MSLRMAAYACLMRRRVITGLVAVRRRHRSTLEGWADELQPYFGEDPSSAQASAIKLVTGTHISAAWFDSVWPNYCFLYLLSLSVGHYDNIAIKPIKLWININQNANSTPIQFHKYLKHLVHSHRNASIKKKNWIIRVWGLAVSGSNAEYSREEMCNSGSDGIK